MITAIFSTSDDEVGLAQALVALVPAATEGFVRDVIVVDNGSRDGTLEVADAAGCTIAQSTGDAVERARAEWLMFLSPRATLEAGWQSEVVAFIDRTILAGEGRRRAAIFRYARADGSLRSRFAAIRSRLIAPFEEQGLILSRALFRSLTERHPDASIADIARWIGRLRLTVLRSRALMQPAGRAAIRSSSSAASRASGARRAAA